MTSSAQYAYRQSLHGRLPPEVYLDGQVLVPAELECIGAGKTGAVYRIPNEQAVKIFWQDALEEKLRFLQEYGAATALKHCAFPTGMLRDGRGQVLGYRARFAAGRPFLQTIFREPSTGLRFLRWLQTLAETLEMLHADDIALGDFANGNLLGGKAGLQIVDVDGWSLPGHRSVWHNQIVDPLYDSARQEGFEPANDVFALAYILCRSLTKLSPYAGLCAGLSERERSLRGLSVFEPETIKPPGHTDLDDLLPRRVREYLQAVCAHETRALPDEYFWKELLSWSKARVNEA